MNTHRRRLLLVVLWAALAGVGGWALDRYAKGTNSAQLVLVVLVGLLIVILLEATFAVPDALDRMSKRLLGLHGAVAQQSRCLVAWNDADAVEALKILTESGSDPSTVRAVWAPLEASADFKEYIADTTAERREVQVHVRAVRRRQAGHVPPVCRARQGRRPACTRSVEDGPVSTFSCPRRPVWGTGDRQSRCCNQLRMLSRARRRSLSVRGKQ